MRFRFQPSLGVIGCGLVTVAVVLSPPRLAGAAADRGGSAAIDATAISDPTRDPPEPGDDGRLDEDTSGRALRIPCLDDLSPDGQPRKGVQKRPFLKRKRLELSALGGLYASDVLSSSYTAGGALSFYPSEDFGVELMVTRSPVEFRLEQPYAEFDRLNRFVPGAAFSAMFGLVYAPFHAKFKFSEDNIVTGDIVLVGGAGRTFHDSVQGLTWQAGVGIKLYLWNFLTFRLDIRNLVQPQEVLGRAHVTNNIVAMGGLSLWLF